MESLKEEERRQKVKEDLELIKRYDEGLESTLAYAKKHPELFPKSEDVELTPQQKHELRVIWQTVLDYMRALDGVKTYWKEFHKYGLVKERRAHAEAFMVGYTAWMVQYRHGLTFFDLTVPSKPMEKLLDESAPRYDIPGGGFAALKWNIIHVKAIARLMGSKQYFVTVEPALKDADCHKREWCSWGMGTIDGYHTASLVDLRERAAIQFSYNAFDIVRDMSFDAWFPVQKNVAEWMGDTRVRRLHAHLIGAEQIEELNEAMQPGDIIVARHNWYLSNIGLPGFWPHAELYLGDEETLTAFFDDEEVNGYMQAHYGAESLVAYLKSEHPEAWKAYLAESSDGHTNRIIEALSEGVVFSSLEHGIGADYVGVMRPIRSKSEIATAVINAFELHGLPYDFNFDFVTDESIVCTELVYKAYQPDDKYHGLELELQEVMGRKTLPANDIVRQFDEQYDKKDKQLEFVAFIDGREKEKSAVKATLADFRASWKRPKWDVMQK